MTTVKIGGRVLKALARVSMVTALLAAVATGASAQDGVSKTTVTLGQSVAMTGPAAVLALPFAQGARLYFERVNAAGGIHGRKIELTTVDDAGNPETTLANTKKLLDQRVFSLFGYYGSEAESFSVAGTQALPAAVRGDCGGTRTNCAAHSRD